MPMILGRLQINRVVRTASFEVSVSLPSPGSADRAVGRCSRHSKIHSGMGAYVEAFVDSSSATALLAQGICCKFRASKSFSNFCAWNGYLANSGSLQLHSPLTCLMICWESPFTSSYWTPRDSVALSLNMKAS
jgi:hypothetical protein